MLKLPHVVLGLSLLSPLQAHAALVLVTQAPMTPLSGSGSV